VGRNSMTVSVLAPQQHAEILRFRPLGCHRISSLPSAGDNFSRQASATGRGLRLPSPNPEKASFCSSRCFAPCRPSRR
jgi:hypothetical protein